MAEQNIDFKLDEGVIRIAKILTFFEAFKNLTKPNNLEPADNELPVIFKKIEDFDDKKGVAFALGSAVAKKAASRPSSTSSQIGKNEEVHEIDRVFAQLDTVLKSAESADKEEMDPIQSPYRNIKLKQTIF